jgi:hypothetical protein
VQVQSLVRQLPRWDKSWADETVWPEVRQLGLFADYLSSKPPKRVSAIVAVSPRDDREPRRYSLRLVAIARFRAEYSIIERVAHAIAPAIVESGIVPIIHPFRVSEFEEMPEDAPLIRRMFSHGRNLWNTSYDSL